MQPADGSREYGNLQQFLLHGGLLASNQSTFLYSRVDFIFVVAHPEATHVRVLIEADNLRVVEAPGAYSDLSSFGCLAHTLGQHEDWFAGNKYARVFGLTRVLRVHFGILPCGALHFHPTPPSFGLMC
jgi:hypothetical protein